MCAFISRYKANFTSFGVTINFGEERFMVSSLSWVLRKRHPLTPELSKLVGWAHAGGIIKEMQRRVKEATGNSNTPSKKQDDGHNAQTVENSLPLGLNEFNGAFLIFAVGLGLAMLTFLIEILSNRV